MLHFLTDGFHEYVVSSECELLVGTDDRRCFSRTQKHLMRRSVVAKTMEFGVVIYYYMLGPSSFLLFCCSWTVAAGACC